MAGLIQGPCEVLPPTKFQEESERRSKSELEPNTALRPAFLCKYVSSIFSCDGYLRLVQLIFIFIFC